MKLIERVIVDECVGRESALLGQLRSHLGARPIKFVFLATEHPGIPDIEILDKLLDGCSALLTQDRALHNLAISRGFRSFVHTAESVLTDRPLAHVSVPDKCLPVSSGTLRSYEHQRDPEAQAITGCLVNFLSAHQLKQFRTKRRRIRAHFGSPDNIAATALTIGQRRTSRGILGGYMLKVDARHGVKSLVPASESYFLDRASVNESLQATSWALLHLFQLQLQSYPLTLYHLDGAALARCTALIADCGSAATAIERMAARLLAAVSQPKVAECSKGRFFDRASEKLGQLARFDTNELVSVDLQAMAAALPSHCARMEDSGHGASIGSGSIRR
jgi:hypothetical protein